MKCLSRQTTFLWVISAFLVTGCATHAPAPVSDASRGQVLDTQVDNPAIDDAGGSANQPVTAGPVPPVTKAEEPFVLPQERGRPSAVDALLERSSDEYQRGDYQRSVATAERALRIDRRSGEVYLLLAQNYHRLGNPQQAAQFARQGLRYSSDDRTLTWQLERLLAKVDG
ncbi:tetratricopeptide repeat protein [Gilvimarinus sp. SDUM040013]|nr:tetratricopeptide repeat protein [Gilvimarinus sp. SDUM040013]MDO3386080.1 tetratricopeptide repeat protein [Gilvimarinus sp. SDUM040013]